MELEDGEVFEITDYTNATNWEVFMWKLEEILSNYEKTEVENTEMKNLEVEEMRYDKMHMLIGLFSPKIYHIGKNQQNLENSVMIKQKRTILSEFESSIDWELIKWFGRSKFIVITAKQGSSIYGLDQIKQIINSVTVAMVNIKCQLPVLIKHGSKNWTLYQGLILDNDFKSKLQTAIIKHIPKQCQSLHGLRRMFQEKLGKGHVLDDDITITAKYTYRIENNPLRNPRYFHGTITKQKPMHFFQYLTLGFAKDPIKLLKLYAYWPKVPKSILAHSDKPNLPVSSCPEWYLMSNLEYSYDGLHYKTLRKLLKTFLVAEKPNEIIKPKRMTSDSFQSISQPLVNLTHSPIRKKLMANSIISQISLTNSISNKPMTNQHQQTQILDDSIVQSILLFLFPDAQTTSNQSKGFPYPYNFDEDLNLPHVKKLQAKYKTYTNQFSLVHRLAICLTNLLSQHKDGLKCFAFIWQEVVLELTYRLENNIPQCEINMDEKYRKVTSAKEGQIEIHEAVELYDVLLQQVNPNSAQNKIEELMQTLDYCVLARLRNKFIAENFGRSSETTEDDDQFFECNNPEDCVEEARGRLKPFGDQKMKEDASKQLYIPLTQILPITLEIFDDSDVSGQTALLSDMSAFKSANPGCVLSDFIRWYSPRDYCENSGQLSQRMTHTAAAVATDDSTDSNYWLNSWTISEPRPAYLQRRLFNDTAHAQIALTRLTNLTIAEIASSLISHVLIDSVFSVADCLSNTDAPELLLMLDHLAQSLLTFFEATDLMDVTGSELEYYQSFDEIINLFQQIEYKLAIKHSLQLKLNYDPVQSSASSTSQLNGLINQLILSKDEVNISAPTDQLDRATQQVIFSNLCAMYKLSQLMDSNNPLYSNIDEIYASADQREYIMNLVCCYPFSTSRKSTQRMYVMLQHNDSEEMRVATSLCEDVTYF